MAFQTATRLRELLDGAGARPRRRYGQHFLVDRNLMMRLVDSATLGPGDVVLEIGTGTGSLTSLLAERAGRVHTFEIDGDLAEIATQQLAAFANVELHRGDALQSQTVLSPALDALLDDAAGRLKLVANLPYDVATPLLMNLLLADHPPSCLCFTIQREVGERLMAEVGTRDYGPASILCRLYSRLERMAVIGPQAFWPPPKVESVMMRMTTLPEMPSAVERRQVAEMVRAAFTMRRKTLRRVWADRGDAEQVQRMFDDIGLAADVRPAEVTPEQWRRLALRIGR